MSSPQNSLYSTPAFEIFRRAYTTNAVQQFRGMNSYNTSVLVGPQFALDCLNVIVSGSGGLEKFRLPVTLTPNVNYASGPNSFWDFQYYLNGVTPTRQVIANFGNDLWVFTNNLSVGTKIASGAIYAGPWSCVEANNELFMANGQIMLKWDGTHLYNWGIAAPVNAPVLGAVTGAQTIANAPTGVVITAGSGPTGNILTITPAVAGTFDGFQNGPYSLNLTVAGTSVAGINAQTFAFVPTIAAGHVTALSATTSVAPTTGGGGTLTPVGTGNLLFGHTYGYAYQSADGHISSISPITASTGTQNLQLQSVSASAPTDPQVVNIVWFRSLDGGGILYRVPNPFNNGQNWPINNNGLTLEDQYVDTQLDQNSPASFINNPPPIGKYLTLWQGRIFIGNLKTAPQTVAYSGYEQILIGRPEQSYPANNAFNLSLGAEGISGIGSLMHGVVMYSSTGTLWMLRGAVEDITQNAPVQFTESLTEYPFVMGNFSQNSTKTTPYGIIWLAEDKSVNLFEPSQGPPQDIGQVIYPQLSEITPGTEQLAAGAYFHWLERDWYTLLVSRKGSATLNKGYAFSLNASTQQIDVFPFDIQADFIGVIRDQNLQRILCISQQGFIKQLPVSSVTVAGVSNPITETAGQLSAYWKGGYFGNDLPYRNKSWRKVTLVADNQGFGLECRFVDDQTRTFANPEIINFPTVNASPLGLNRRANRCSIKIVFPTIDIACSVQELSVSYIGTSDR